jgi:hypothetical protein
MGGRIGVSDGQQSLLTSISPESGRACFSFRHRYLDSIAVVREFSTERIRNAEDNGDERQRRPPGTFYIVPMDRSY